MNVLQGDTASVAALASLLRRRAAELSRMAARLELDQEQARHGWVGPVAVGHRRRLDAAYEAAQGCAREMVGLAEALDAYGQALSEARLQVRRAEEEAASVGMVLEDGALVQGWGIVGEASTAADEARQEVAQRLARRLARTTTLLERRRGALAQRAEEVTRSLR